MRRSTRLGGGSQNKGEYEPVLFAFAVHGNVSRYCCSCGIPAVAPPIVRFALVIEVDGHPVSPMLKQRRDERMDGRRLQQGSLLYFGIIRSSVGVVDIVPLKEFPSPAGSQSYRQSSEKGMNLKTESEYIRLHSTRFKYTYICHDEVRSNRQPSRNLRSCVRCSDWYGDRKFQSCQLSTELEVETGLAIPNAKGYGYVSLRSPSGR